MWSLAVTGISRMASETVSEVRNEPDQRKVDNGTSAGITEDQQKAPLGTPVCSSSHRTQVQN